MAKTVADVMKMVKDNEVKFVDFRFTDTRGQEQHVTVPVSYTHLDVYKRQVSGMNRTAGALLEGTTLVSCCRTGTCCLALPISNCALTRPVCATRSNKAVTMATASGRNSGWA